ncbi:MAG: hypothetical protein WD733_15615 [Bryobacterales bacterium]
MLRPFYESSAENGRSRLPTQVVCRGHGGRSTLRPYPLCEGWIDALDRYSLAPFAINVPQEALLLVVTAALSFGLGIGANMTILDLMRELLFTPPTARQPARQGNSAECKGQ